MNAFNTSLLVVRRLMGCFAKQASCQWGCRSSLFYADFYAGKAIKLRRSRCGDLTSTRKACWQLGHLSVTHLDTVNGGSERLQECHCPSGWV